MDGLHWPGYGIVCHFSVDEVVLEIPALFEDILLLRLYLARLTGNAIVHIATRLQELM